MRTIFTTFSLTALIITSSACDPELDGFDIERALDFEGAPIVEGTVDFVVDFDHATVALPGEGPLTTVCYDPEAGTDLDLRFSATTGAPFVGWVTSGWLVYPLQATDKYGTELDFRLDPVAAALGAQYVLRFAPAEFGIKPGEDGESIRPTLILKPKKDCPTGEPGTPSDEAP